MYKPLKNYSNDLDALFEKGITRGVYCGFEALHPYFTVRPSATTYIYGSPTSGKTEFWFEILVSLSEMYFWKHALYTPESGTRTEVMAELISKYCRKPFYKQIGNHITEQEFYHAKAWVSEYFFIIDPEDQDITIQDFYKEVDRIEAEFGVTINTTCCDPFNELKHDFSDSEGRQDLYIENRLGFIRRNAMKHKRHNSIITHVSRQDLQKGTHKSGSEIWYYPPPATRQIAGGEAWYRKAMNLLSVWRPPEGLLDKEGREYEPNEVHVTIQKYKPKWTGQKGTVKLYYDIAQNRYYEKWGDGKRYSGKQQQNLIQENINYEF